MSDTARHLAGYADGDTAHLRRHLNNDHPETRLTYGLVSPHASRWTCQNLHRHLHGADHPATPPAAAASVARPGPASDQLTFPTEAPA